MAKVSSVSVALGMTAVAVALAVGGYAASRYDIRGTRGSGLPPAFRYDRGDAASIDPARVLYRQTAALPVPFRKARGVTVGPGDRIHVVGDRALAVLDSAGAKGWQVALEDEPQAVAVAGAEHAFPGRIYVALKTRVEVLAADGGKVASWADLGPKALLTSVAVGEHDVVAADAGQRVIHRYDATGRLLGRIAARDPNQEDSGLILPSPHCDVAFAADGLVRVANTGKHRIEGYTLDGHRETAWGRPGLALEGFCGCCNPIAFALLPDGRVVTVEKGVARVKVYTAEGKFLGVVAGPDTLKPRGARVDAAVAEDRQPIFDVAADSRGRVLVLDPLAGQIRIFETKEP